MTGCQATFGWMALSSCSKQGEEITIWTWAVYAHGKDDITAGLTLTGVQESIKETHMPHSLMQQGKFS